MRRVALTCSTRLPPGKPFTGAGASERRKSEKVHLFPGSTLLILQSRFGRHLHHPRAPDGQCSLVACERYQFSRPRGHFTASGALRQKRRFGMHGLSLAEKGRIFSPSLVTALARNIQRTIWTQRISSETCQYYSPPRPVWRLAGLPVRGRCGQRSELELGSCRAAVTSQPVTQHARERSRPVDARSYLHIDPDVARLDAWQLHREDEAAEVAAAHARQAKDGQTVTVVVAESVLSSRRVALPRGRCQLGHRHQPRVRRASTLPALAADGTIVGRARRAAARGAAAQLLRPRRAGAPAGGLRGHGRGRHPPERCDG